MIMPRLLGLLLVASSSLASPLKIRATEVVATDCATVIDTITVIAPEAVQTVYQDVTVTGAPVIVVDTQVVQVTDVASPVEAVDYNAAITGTSMTSVVATKTDSTVAANPLNAVVSTLSTVWATSVKPDPSSSTISLAASTVSSAVQDSLLPPTTPASTQTVSIPVPATPLTASFVPNLQAGTSAYASLALYAHNVHRSNHSDTPPLVYNATLEDYAKEKAITCQWTEDLPHDAKAADVGMNMAEGTYIGAANITSIISDMWYSGEEPIFPGYGIANPNMANFDAWGHFTQVVWKSTASMGCYSSPCARQDGAANKIGSGYYTVCMYWPPANLPGEYAGKVGRPLGHATVDGV